MPTPEVEEFAQRLVEFVRDQAIAFSDVILHPDSPDPTAKRLRKAVTNSTPMEFARLVIPMVVDETVAHLLDAIDNDHLKLTYTASNGRTVKWIPDADFGGLCGWYASGKWTKKYSKERYMDNDADLAPPESE